MVFLYIDTLLLKGQERFYLASHEGNQGRCRHGDRAGVSHGH